MRWDIIIAIGAALSQFATSWLGWRVTLHPPDPRRKRVYEFFFLFLGIAGVLLVGMAAYLTAPERAHLQTEIRQAYTVSGAGWMSFLVLDKPVALNIDYENVGAGPATNVRFWRHSFLEPEVSEVSEGDAIRGHAV